MSDTPYEETEKAALAARFVNSTNRNVFLTGKAGTGKTTFLHQLAAKKFKKFISKKALILELNTILGWFWTEQKKCL